MHLFKQASLKNPDEVMIRHFKAREFLVGGEKVGFIDCDLLYLLYQIRLEFGKIIITSGFRTPEHNIRVGGAPESMHMYGQAADIKPANATIGEVVEWLNHKHPDDLGIGVYATYIHVDTRKEKARW